MHDCTNCKHYKPNSGLVYGCKEHAFQRYSTDNEFFAKKGTEKAEWCLSYKESMISLHIYKLRICKLHQATNCVICDNYLNNTLMKGYATKNTKEAINRLREQINKWIEEDYNTIIVADPKYIFNKLKNDMKEMSWYSKEDEKNILAMIDYHKTKYAEGDSKK